MNRTGILLAPSNSPARLRPAVLCDYAGMMEVWKRNGLRCGQGTDCSFWRQFWEENPFNASFEGTSIGWVLETEAGEIVGTFSNIPTLLHLNGKILRSAIASAWAVDRQYRSISLRLVLEYLGQPNIDLFVDTTASAEAGLIFQKLGAQRVPHPCYDEVLFWVTHHSHFAAAMMRRAHIPDVPGCRYILGSALRINEAFQHTRRLRCSIETTLTQSFDPRFDEFWEKLRGRADRLLSTRSSAALRWHFLSAARSGGLTVITASESGRSLCGYLILTRRDEPQIGLRRYAVADLQVASDNPDHVKALLCAALQHASNTSVDVVEVVGFDEFKRTILAEAAPYRRMHPCWPYLYVLPKDTALRETLRRSQVWDPSPFDGDATL